MGAVDEVYIYTTALSQGQLRQLACLCEDSEGNATPIAVTHSQYASKISLRDNGNLK